MYYATAQEMEKLDRLVVEQGLEIRQMMELAGWHMVSLFDNLKISKHTNILVVVGKGNKGGDGLCAARHLVNYGWNVKILLLSRAISKDSAHHLKLLEKMQVSIKDFSKSKESIKQCDILVDALIGYHLDGTPRGVFKEAIQEMNNSGKNIISYDLPSGIDPDTGECLEFCIQAFATLSLVMPKKLFETEQGKAKSGHIFVADIGIPTFLYDQIAPGSRPVFDTAGGLVVL